MTALWREWRIFILEWALREINPTHRDVPDMVRELHYHYGRRPRGQV